MQKVLIVDDEADIRKTLRVLLKKISCEEEEAENGKVALEKIVKEPPDLIPLDIQMPILDGFETCRRLREELGDTDTYVIALTAKSDVHHRVKGLNLGFSVYLSKPFNNSELLVYVRKELEQTLKLRQASIDGLTGLPNREDFKHVFVREIARSQRHNTPLSLVILDLDHFKSINDESGHSAGNEVLVIFADLVQATVRKGDLFLRWGGDEFGFILPNTTSNGAKIMLDSICNAVRRHDFLGLGSGVITASIGITELRTGNNQSNFFKRADNALYKSKNNGRDCASVL